MRPVNSNPEGFFFSQRESDRQKTRPVIVAFFFLLHGDLIQMVIQHFPSWLSHVNTCTYIHIFLKFKRLELNTGTNIFIQYDQN